MKETLAGLECPSVSDDQVNPVEVVTTDESGRAHRYLYHEDEFPEPPPIHAGFWIRLSAYSIDFVILTIVLVALTYFYPRYFPYAELLRDLAATREISYWIGRGGGEFVIDFATSYSIISTTMVGTEGTYIHTTIGYALRGIYYTSLGLLISTSIGETILGFNVPSAAGK